MIDGADLMLATLTDRRFSDPAWLFDRKLDGERCLGVRDSAGIRLQSRTGHDLTASYPEVAAALADQPATRFAVDGELCAFVDGQTSFSRLQRRLGVTHPANSLLRQAPVVLCLFDILALDGRDLRILPLRQRRQLLATTISPDTAVRLVEQHAEDGVGFYTHACESGWEGVIAKRADSPYTRGRSRDWLKFKCLAEQELVVGGYTDPTGHRTHFGALLVGYYDARGRLRYAGKVGTGFTAAVLAALGSRLAGLEQTNSPFVDARPVPAGTHWVEPKLVAQIAFAEWTTAGRLRQPRFLGLRDDKPAAEVVREAPETP